MNDELKRIFPAEIYKLEYGGEVSVSPVPFGKLSAFGEALASIVQKLALSGIELENVTVNDLGRVFGVAFEEVVGIMALVLNKDRAWFDTITLGDGMGILALILKQNFNDDTKKKLAGLVQRIPSLST